MPYAQYILCVFYLAMSTKNNTILSNFANKYFMIKKYRGKIQLKLPNVEIWPLNDNWLQDQYVYHMNLERTYYFYIHESVDPVCLQYYGYPGYGYAPWCLHPGINRIVGSALRSPNEWLDCIVASETNLTNVPDWLLLFDEFSSNPDLDLSTDNGNWHKIRSYLTAETSRDQVPGHGHWIVEAHQYTRSVLKNKKINIYTHKGIIEMNKNGNEIIDFYVKDNKFIETIQSVFLYIKKLDQK